MIVCITEKPSVAQDIAAILGAGVRRDGFYEWICRDMDFRALVRAERTA